MAVTLFSDTQNTSSIVFTITNGSPFMISSIFLNSDQSNTKNVQSELYLDGTNLSSIDVKSSFKDRLRCDRYLFTNIKLPANAVVKLKIKQLEEPLSSIKLESVILTGSNM